MESTNGDGTEDGLALLFGAPDPSPAPPTGAAPGGPVPGSAAPGGPVPGGSESGGEPMLTRRERRAREEAEARGAAASGAPAAQGMPGAPLNPPTPVTPDTPVTPRTPVNPDWPAPSAAASPAPLPEPWPMPPPSGSTPVVPSPDAPSPFAPRDAAPTGAAAPFPRPDLVPTSTPPPVLPPVSAFPGPPAVAPRDPGAPSDASPRTSTPSADDRPLLASYFAPEVAQPEVAQPEVAQPDIVRPGAPAHPEAPPSWRLDRPENGTAVEGAPIVDFRPPPDSSPGPGALRPETLRPDSFRPEAPRPGLPLLPSNDPPPPPIEEIERSTIRERLGLILAFLLPPVGLVLAIGNAVGSRRRRGWVTGLVRSSVAVGVVFTLLAGIGGVVLAELRAQALRFDELRQASTVFCGAVATRPELIELPTFGWPDPASTIPESIAAMQAYSAGWAALVDDVPAEIRGDVLTLAGTGSRIAAAVAVARTVDDVQNQAAIGSVAARSALPEWHAEYCVTG